MSELFWWGERCKYLARELSAQQPKPNGLDTTEPPGFLFADERAERR